MEASTIKFTIQHGKEYCHFGINTGCEMIIFPNGSDDIFCKIFGRLEKIDRVGAKRHPKCIEMAQPIVKADANICKRCGWPMGNPLFCVFCAEDNNRTA